MNKELLGLFFLPAGVFSMCGAALWQMYVVMNESYTLNRFKDRQLVWAVAAMFFSFSLAVYWLCPNARKKRDCVCRFGFRRTVDVCAGQDVAALETLKSRYFSFRRPSNHEEAV
jgi:putative membrane protein